jgi:hypothetical protein
MLKVAVSPSFTVWLDGLVVIVGAASCSMRIAALLSAEPAGLETLQRNR